MALFVIFFMWLCFYGVAFAITWIFTRLYRPCVCEKTYLSGLRGSGWPCSRHGRHVWRKDYESFWRWKLIYYVAGFN